MRFLKIAFGMWLGIILVTALFSAISSPSAPAEMQPAPSGSTAASVSPEAQELAERRERGLNSMKAEFEQPERKGQIDPFALMPYTRDQYPQTVAKYGKAIPALERDRAKAAKIAAAHPDCDVVQNVQVTTRSPMVNRRYWAECSNITRLFFDEESLAAGKPVKVQTVADMGRDGLADW